MHPLEHALNYPFRDPALLTRALTHRSHSAAHNERLEFLGDALLETISSIWIYRNRGNVPEGGLTRLRATIVSGQNLAAIARRLNLGQYLHLGSGELKSGGARRDSILADAVEALIAAVYLDSDYPTCERITLALIADDLAALPESATRLKDAKTQLQEYLQGRGLPLPDYQIISETGPEHAREFQIEATSGDYRATARGNSRKKAEQEAAADLLAQYQSSKHE